MPAEERVHTIADMAEVLHDIFAVGNTHREVADASAILAVLHCKAVGERVVFARPGGVGVAEQEGELVVDEGAGGK
ncbi:MAG: hypothetical protein HOL51_09735 [Gemmatimonadetes bacterium]|nr:hypothetical protein [Gemmatimonadota bacterium]MBT5326396.1 hypothetical protein [Gemmatimonadota bacterium]MBT5800469.1 hypothetical protein [Gemmatimonadota bacterium]MBT6618967.1 hypothetical protein [Gemmatimonadota bacterium]MBT6902595.1 hypothetical protein [Gemmatimonadota bacterium]